MPALRRHPESSATSSAAPNPDRRNEIAVALGKAAAVVVVIGLVVWIGSWLMVKGLGLDQAPAGNTAAAPSSTAPPVKPLPDKALPVPDDDEDASDEDEGADEDADDEADDEAAEDGEFTLEASPARVGTMERINLTGQWPGQDAVVLAVQRKQDGAWADFGVSAQVSVGTYSTWVMTGRVGEQKFRMYHPGTDTASNVVTITVGE